nr:60S ribosomal protein L12 [Cryptomonas paramecium]
MLSKSDSTSPAILFIRTVGGETGAVSSLAPKIGPLGLSPKKVGEQLSLATKEWEGLRVTCKLLIQNKQITVQVVPSVATFIIKALNEPLRDRKKVKNIKHTGNISWKNVISICKLVKSRSNSIDTSGLIKEVLGTANSIGCCVENYNSSKKLSFGIDDRVVKV